MDVLVLQHIACEPPGAFEDVLTRRRSRHPPRRARRGRAASAVAGLRRDRRDGRPDERERRCRAAVAHRSRSRRSRKPCGPGVPYWGSCLGVQLLAASLGARVYPGTQPEVGVLPGDAHRRGARPTRSSPRLPAEFLTLQWHGDTFDLPEGASRLASSPAYPNQAFRFGQTGLRRPVPRRGDRPDGARVGRRSRPTPSTPTACWAPAASTGSWPTSTPLAIGCSMSAGACSSAGSRLQSPSPDSRFLALRFAAQEATDFGMNDDEVRRFVELRDQAAADDAIAQELGCRRRGRDGAREGRRRAGRSPIASHRARSRCTRRPSPRSGWSMPAPGRRPSRSRCSSSSCSGRSSTRSYARPGPRRPASTSGCSSPRSRATGRARGRRRSARRRSA